MERTELNTLGEFGLIDRIKSKFTKFLKIIDNCFTIQGIELLTALQSIQFRRPLKSSSKNEEIIAKFRKEISFTVKDEFMQPKIQKAREFVLKLQE